ncbi:TetR/AcrR family transcriptional regulator [Dactylosporangium sucinum]|uniref:HTH tetR-type domain-containing protein n=1 Tax=Dactylosporangium sucinum TaxID=1424081 RepID=A0A917U483_9ACTN|nr:TetR/AcrR family transcriptional regulator [Dactylosporangium sucinum]GGM56512.1 hypothetical protein GCM10007977_067850 [Dactylosporangium sucinum]
MSELPNGLRLSWGLVEAPTRGRPASITAGEIVAAGVGLADAEGLAAVSMPRVAAQVGVTQNALYRHIASKAELVMLMADEASGPPPVLETGDGWRAAVRVWAGGLIARYQAHPWLLDVRLRAPVTRNAVLWTEAFLQATRGIGLPVEQRLECALLVDGYARHIAALSRDLADYEAGATADLVPLLEANGCTELAAYLRAAPSGGGFEFGLERVLDGMAALL